MKSRQNKSLAILFAILSLLSLFTTADEHDHVVKHINIKWNYRNKKYRKTLIPINLVQKRG